VVLLGETWLNSSIKTAELGFDGFKVYRCDRSVTTSDRVRGGGVLIAISNRFTSSRVRIKHTAVEHVFVNVRVKSQVIIFVCVYIPPASDVAIYKAHSEVIEELYKKYPKARVIIVGDYNLPNIGWVAGADNDDLEVMATLDRPCEKTASVLDMFHYLQLHQLNLVRNHNNRILDLVFSGDTNVRVSPSASEILPQYISTTSQSEIDMLCLSSKILVRRPLTFW
jgi:hypothetical protein